MPRVATGVANARRLPPPVATRPARGAAGVSLSLDFVSTADPTLTLDFIMSGYLVLGTDPGTGEIAGIYQILG